MTNPKGTFNETAFVKYARLNGFEGADRKAKHGSLDQGDVDLCPGIVVEVKAVKGAGTGQPGAKQLAGWMAEAEAERHNAAAWACPLVVKRTGTTDPGQWWAYITADICAWLMGTFPIERLELPDLDPICMSVASLVALIRHHGYGDPLGEAA